MAGVNQYKERFETIVNDSNHVIPTEVITEQGELVLKKSDLDSGDAINLENVMNDYNKMRKIILGNVEECKNLSVAISEDMKIEGFNPELVKAYTDLIKTTNQSLSILTDSYKKISDILLNLKKLNHNDSKESDKEKIYEIASTIEIIRKLQSTNEDCN